ncbi:MAG: DUF4180 domain-containing protein [Anaerolineales bacterium]|nr:DUF4180 domain-containing protein [Anaerolineales bacterium]
MMQLTLIERDGNKFLLGPAGQPLLSHADEATELLQACADHQTDRLLLYAENLTEGFFDLSTGDAGAILHRLRIYHVRLAVVWSPQKVHLSHRFGELMVEENRNPYFRLFEQPQEAEEWLLRD